ncbi:MAG: 30S ribosomal protein S16 [Magnetococcales bacterium]|nr:30S ribosomal protein S16 [Magnetococcales bacterium]MBF0148595.1 30S ribosomal protein S16 [Magnetococcales bacterium]MBF0172275.1 30S ribosomal protein S16 [Magnetococcales bacterium]MBF0347324.1 30S ribosomal protein S16 [Magnetococcales bacterium]MBF0629712.1 30S ribosomal protein S16 [Magnetococcales bacterium]
MAVRIRMQRRGSKKKPFYAVVAADSRMPRDGRFLEKLGTYDPRLETDGLNLNMDRVNHWIGMGAQPSDPLAKLLKSKEPSA